MARTRRDLIRYGGVGLLAAIAIPRTAQEQTVAEMLPRLLPDPDSAAVIGRAWLNAQMPAVEGHGVVLAALQADVIRALAIAGQDQRHLDLGSLRTRLQARIRQDFTEADVVMVEGWMLSRVEAQVCAIAWLTTPPADQSFPQRPAYG